VESFLLFHAFMGEPHPRQPQPPTRSSERSIFTFEVTPSGVSPPWSSFLQLLFWFFPRRFHNMISACCFDSFYVAWRFWRPGRQGVFCFQGRSARSPRPNWVALELRLQKAAPLFLPLPIFFFTMCWILSSPLESFDRFLSFSEVGVHCDNLYPTITFAFV